MPSSHSLPELVARQIEAMILDGRLKAGGRLPSERKLVERLKVSRNTLREALKVLRTRGVIEARRGSGHYVCNFGDMQPQLQRLEPGSPLQQLLQNHPQTLESLLEVRRLLEGEAAYLAAQRATEEDMDKLKAVYEALVDEHPERDSAADHAERDMHFHHALYAAAHSPILLLALNSIRDLMVSFVFDTSDKLYFQDSIKNQLRTQHRRIYRAIEQRNPAAARRAARAHIDAVVDSLNT
ncbi:FadR/GntR family transcriptional regulator [Marinobacterium marinum]|uniref:FCD domain-containing protein n=1 Tax=Marinobacterium marinum TaxID=2756129 RepID=A0A7W1WVE1_9GAMM|nr:FCD domain-containing protein [Marinobacterium marinum]MBA4500941.1 FCD domain-containing protein [Marinobacterium marinum]